MEEKLSGIVISSVVYGENDKILNIFTLEKGMISARIKGVKKAGAKLKFASEPFCFAEYVFSTFQDKRTVIGASLIDSFYPVRENIVKFYSAGVLCEFTKKFAKEEIVSTELFLSLIDCFKQIAYTDIDSRVHIVRFLLKSLKIIGYGLNLNGCLSCGTEITKRPFFDYLSGGFYCEECFNGIGREINFSTYQTLKNIFENETFETCNLNMAIKLLDYYISNKIEENISSLKELVKFN